MRKAVSQWEFGDLFTEGERKKTYSVGEITGVIRRLLEGKLGRIRVTGEISNYRKQSSGHCYFALKDASAQLSCVLFRRESVSHRSDIGHGAKVILEGDLTVYEARGQYQLIVRSVELDGVGALQRAFEQLKAKLESEGLFASERKREIPRYCFRLGIVTSESAAALRDVLQVTGRRHPALEWVLHPTRVQGQDASDEIVGAIHGLNRYSMSLPPERRLGAILITRGGGSLEDLWAFNEESVARAVAASALPTISAIGHETDFTICDFVADLRAPTPSAAAELVTEGIFASRDGVEHAAGQMQAILERELEYLEGILRQVGRRLAVLHPRRVIERCRVRIDDFENGLARTLSGRKRGVVQQLDRLTFALSQLQPRRRLVRENGHVQLQAEHLAKLVRQTWKARRQQMDYFDRVLKLLSPLNILERGYSITRESESGRVVRSIKEIDRGTLLTTLLCDGEIHSEVREVGENSAAE